ncbi:MAG: FAD-dependent oxidoreductase [Bacteroidales bacterium]|nr:FAD-dependent oxidoreductase [Bacteroidales bacterium]MDY0198170.1 FAD-dependent oxidoreductase [Tenuifilaceae bacterium]
MSQLKAGHYFGVQEELFFVPTDSKFETIRFGQPLGTPIGPAAGPHTQLSQNIVGAWLCGARYIELKTVQTLDELDVSKPCIDLQDEGYNCEWSQELLIHQSFEQYLDAWIMIHLLAKHLKWEGAAQKTIFNMSVGYNLEGILKPNVQWFFSKMNSCEDELNAKIDDLAKDYPWVKDVKIPNQISNNITLSTMHGCPPDEIERIGMYLIRERGLHTIIKLNPTLLGSEKVRSILNKTMEFKTPVPDQAFEHDLKYPDALGIIKNLQQAAKNKGVFFGLKLTNTLESNNFRNVFAENQKQMYMSGKALHPLAVNLAAKIRRDFPNIDISFSAGADCFNIHELLACNLSPVTVSSDLLKPGGYGRLSQYLINLKDKMAEKGFETIKELIFENPENKLREYSDDVLENLRFKKALREPNIKTLRPLNFYDCIHAPCMSTCPDNQNIPSYMHYVAKGEWQKAFEVIMQTNPFPSITGTVCDHECQTKCTRIHYDDALAIREIKRYVASFEHNESFIKAIPYSGLEAAVIGAGPAGLSCAWYLRLAGFRVTVYEERASAGGMVQQVIPSFRLSSNAIESDIQRITSLGVDIHYNTPVDKLLFEKLKASGNYIFAAIGAANIRKLDIPGEDASGVEDPLEFLAEFKNNPTKPLEAKNIVILGGGNTAMDVARIARKFAKPSARVSIVYRRTISDMPASAEEILAAMHEGIEVKELIAPVEIISKNGKAAILKCTRMQVVGTDEGGRQKVSPIDGSLFDMESDLIIPAVGQLIIWPFADKIAMMADSNGFSTKLDKVYVGGDAKAGASNIISAIADGRKAAEAIIAKAGKSMPSKPNEIHGKAPVNELLVKKGKRVNSLINPPSVDGQHKIIQNHEQAMQEAERCLLCDEICNICVSVCPNFANQSYKTEPLMFKTQTVFVDKDGNTVLKEGTPFEIKQKHQIYSIADFCNECGNCRTFCPTMGAPYKDKPKIHLSNESWDAANEGFRIVMVDNKKGIEYKDREHKLHSVLPSENNNYCYSSNGVSVEFNSQDLAIGKVNVLSKGVKQIEMYTAAQMYVLLKNLPNYLHF